MSDYSATFPPQRPVFNADFSNSSKIDPRATFSRSDSPIDVGKAAASAVHYWSNEKHLSSENLLLQSSGFDTTWSKDSSLNAPAGSQTAPDGTSTAWLLTTAASGTGTPFLFQNPSGAVANNTVCTYVMHIKAGTASHAYISFRGASSSAAWALIDFASPTSPTTGGSLGSISATSVALGSSWYRVALTFDTGTVSSGYPYVYVGASDGTSPDSTGRVSYTYAGETLYAWGAQLSSTRTKVYDSPTTTQISRSYAPTLKSVATAGDPRFEYDPVTNVSLGCLIESQSTNLLLASESFNDSSWTKSDTTVQLNSGVSPAGDLTADLLVESDDTVATSHYVKQSFTPASGVSYTYSFYAKAAGRTNVRIQGVFGGINGYAEVNLSTKAVSGATGSINNVTATDVGNGWVRVEATLGPTTGTGGGDVYVWLNDGSGITYTGNGYGSVLLWGAQLEQASHASSYITTLLSAKTRAADSLSVATADIGYTGGPVTLLAESTTQTDTTNPVTLALYANGDQQIFLYGNSANKRAAYVEADNTSSILTSTADANGVRALRVNTNDIATALNGTIDATDTSQTLPDLTGATVYIGDDSNGGNSIDGHIKRVAIYNEALSDTNLQAITS